MMGMTIYDVSLVHKTHNETQISVTKEEFL